MNERTYRMCGELLPASRMKAWHNSRGIPWGTPYEGPDPMTVSRMEHPTNLTVHIANEHAIDTTPFSGDTHRRVWVHLSAHLRGEFRAGQEHYHRNAANEQLGGLS